MASDEELFSDGREFAMTQLVGRYERPLFHFLVHMVSDVHLAEDLFQETFLRLHRARSQYRSDQPLKPYIFGIALNVVRDARAKRNAGSKTGSLETVPEDEAKIDAREPSPAEWLQRSELRGQVRAAVARLPDAEREVLVLRVFEDLSFAEIARVAQVPLPTAKSRMLYALKRLRPLLESCIEGASPASKPTNSTDSKETPR